MVIERAKKGVLFAIPTLFILMLFFSKTLYFRYTDDEMMNNIARGLFTGKTDEHIIFINALFGYLTKGLYAISKDINWFGILYIIIVLLFIYSLISVLKKHYSFYISIIIGITVEAICILWFTFTVLAYFSVVIGFIKLLDECTYKRDKYRWIHIVIACALIVIGYIMRRDAFLTGLVLVLPMIVISVKRLIKNKHFIISLVAIILCLCALLGLQNYTYKDLVWKNYNEYNELRSGVIDYPISPYKENEKAYSKLSLSKNDIECMKDWCFGDYKVFSPKKLRKVINQTPMSIRYNFKPQTYLKTMREKVVVKSSYYLMIMFLVIFFIVGIVLIIVKGNRPYYICQMIISTGLIWLLFIINRPVPRVLIPIVISTFLCLLYNAIKDKKFKNRKINYISSIILLCFTALLLYKNFDGAKYNKVRYESNQKEVVKFTQNNPKSLFLCQSKHSWLYYKPIISITGNKVCSNIMQTGDQDIYNNCYYSQLKKLGVPDIEKNYLLKTLINRRDTYLLVDKWEDRDILKMVQTFLEEHISEDVRYYKVKSFNNNRNNIYRFELKKDD